MEVFPRSEANNILTAKWVFPIKGKDENGIAKNDPKGRLVARGLQKVPGVDFGETFSPVENFTSFKDVVSTSYVHVSIAAPNGCCHCILME